MPSNITIDDYSPLIQYNGQWLDSFNLSLTIDPNARRYQGNSFHSSQTNGSTATLVFKGTAVYIFEAKRGNHGYYHVSVDGDPGQQFDGYAPPDGAYQVPLFVREGLADGQHTVTLTNIVNGPQRPFVDIDYITWTRKQDVSFNSIIIEDDGFNYSAPTSVWGSRNDLPDYSSNSSHYTTTYGAAASLHFEGNEVFVYGGTSPTHAQFNVKLDNQEPVELNGTAPMLHPKTLLYMASGLTPGPHQLVIANLGDNQSLDIDYAEIVPTKSKSKSGLTKGAIAGIVVGIVIGLAFITLAIWFFFIYRRRKRNRRYSTDFMGSDDSQAAAMRSYSNRHNPMFVEPFVDNPSGQSGDAHTDQVPAGGQERGQNRKGVQAEAMNRGTNEAGSRPGAVTSEAGSSGGSRTVVEIDAGALPPMYDQIERSKVANLPVRI